MNSTEIIKSNIIAILQEHEEREQRKHRNALKKQIDANRDWIVQVFGEPLGQEGIEWRLDFGRYKLEIKVSTSHVTGWLTDWYEGYTRWEKIERLPNARETMALLLKALSVTLDKI